MAAMTPPCIYCGADAGEFDEHEACVEQSCEETINEEDETWR